jgi:hypothetical protein
MCGSRSTELKKALPAIDVESPTMVMAEQLVQLVLAG